MKFRLLQVAFFVLLLNSVGSYGQIAAWDFNGENTANVTSAAEVYNAGLDASNLVTRGAGATASAGGNSFRTLGFQNNGIATTNTDYFQITLSATVGNVLSLSTIDARFAGTTTFAATPGVSNQFAYSLDGTTFMLISTPQALIGTPATLTQISLSGITALQNVAATTTITIRYYASGQTTTGGWGFNSPAVAAYGLAIGGAITTAGITSVANGDWNTAATWSCTCVPTATDNVTIAAAHTVYTTASIARTGTTTVNGNFELRDGGTTTGTNFTYNATTGGLNFNKTTAAAVNNTDPFWPIANSPYNVSVLQGGLTLNATMARSVAGTFSVAGSTVTITAPSTLTLNGICNINTGGSFTNSPIYGSASTLRYNSGGAFNRSYEWTSDIATIGTTPGYPNNVQISNSTAFNYYNATTGPRGINGNLTIDTGSSLNFSATSTVGALTVAGNVVNAGTLTLGAAVGDDIKTAGDFTNTGTFTGNNRAIWFIKTAGTQTVSSTTVPLVIPYVVTANGTTVQMLNSVTISAPTNGNAISFGTVNDVIDLNGNTLIVGTAGVDSVINGTGGFKGSTTSIMTLNGGAGSIGTIKFVTNLNLATLTINRTSGAVACVMGSNLTLNQATSLNLTAGIVDLASFTMTTEGIINSASATNYIIADNAFGGVLRRRITTIAIDYIYPIGEKTGTQEYSPARVNFASGSFTTAYLGMSVNDMKHPNMDATTNFISRYWAVTTAGTFTTPNYTFTGTYLATDINGTESTSQSNQWNGTNWLNNGANIVAASNTLILTGATTLPATNHFSAGRRDQEINIVQGVTNYLTGSTYDFGTVLTGTNSDITFTIQNTGQINLTLGAAAGVVITGNPPYSMLTPYSSTTVTAISGTTPGTRTFVIRFAPTAAGTFTGSVTITSTDVSEPSYVINFTGVGQVPSPDINVQGLGNTIAPGNTPVLTYNTLFASQAIGSTSAANTFTIQNLGTAGLNLSGLSPYVTLGGAHPGDFAIVAIPSNSVGVASSTTFSITFSPTYAGTRTATVTIASNDPDEASYVFNISGNGTCVAPATISSVTPASGPVGTNVTINASSGDLTGTTVTFNSIPATVVSSTATQLVVTVPAGATSGNITITKTATSCVVSTPYTVINITGTCAGLSELIMTELYDQDGGSLGYIEVYNGTGAAIDLTPYFIRRFADNAALIANSYADYSFAPSITTIANGQVRYGRISSDANTASPNFDYSTPGFAGINGDDIFHLYHGTTLVDVYIVPNSTIGYTAKRNTNTAGPNTSSTPSDWTHTNTETLADLGLFVYSGPLSTIPTVTTDPVDVTTCNTTATFTVAATTGPGVGSLSYQWYYNSGTASGWTAVAASSLAGVTASNFNTASLTISGAIGAFDDYQFYCQVTQNTTCNAASDAAQLTVDATVWNGAAWSNGTPTLSTGVVIAGNYDTFTDGSFEACSVAVSPTYTLSINPTDYVAIQNDLFVSATANLTVENNGSLVMIDDDGVVTNNGTTEVVRTTAPFELYDYTYWSSPVNATDIATTFATWRTDYSFEFNTGNFSDTNTIDYNGTITNPGVADSFDDFAPWAWLPYTGTMANGRGYAIMGPTSLTFSPSATTSVTFSGRVNNGLITPWIVESFNAANTADDFNLVGNPYPSAINANTFITTNGAKTSGSLYFWTHVDDVTIVNPGPDLYNFISDDYAVYNLTGGTRASFTGSAVPTGYIASGQGFFVEAQGVNTLTFNNAMRDKGYDNTQFFRSAQPTADQSRIWLNLRNAGGLFGQLLVGYFEETTLDFDWAYDARVNQSKNYLSFYSLGANEKYKIQARPTFDDSDIVPLGYFSAVSGEFSISIDQKEGILNDEATNIYLQDLELNIIHDLKESPYTFTTGTGKFENRFLLRYTDEALDNQDFETLNNSVIVATNHGEMTIKSYVQTIDEVIVYDVLGRQLFQAKGINSNEFTTTNISMSQQSLIVKIKLESGTIVTKKVLW